MQVWRLLAFFFLAVGGLSERVACRSALVAVLMPGLLSMSLAGCGVDCASPFSLGCLADTGVDSGRVDTASTSVAVLSYEADAQTTQINGVTVFAAGHFGYLATSVDGSRRLCEVLYHFAEDDRDPAQGCPECDWVFQLALQDGTATGDGCDNLANMDPKALEGASLSWGFASSYTYSYAGVDEVWNTVLFYGNPGYAWYPMFYNRGYGQDYNVGTAEDAGFFRTAGYVYYYP